MVEAGGGWEGREHCRGAEGLLSEVSLVSGVFPGFLSVVVSVSYLLKKYALRPQGQA